MNTDRGGFSVKTVFLLAVSLTVVSLLALAACSSGDGLPQQGAQETPGPDYQQQYPYGPGGMMGGQGGMMGPGMMGGQGGMTGDWGGYNPQASPITMDQAADSVRRYLNAYGGDLTLAEIMEFEWNFYAEVEEEETGIHAMELLIDRYTGQVYPEMGPNMMWNTKYRMMAQMMGGYYGSGTPATPMTVTLEQAQALAQQYLDGYPTGLTVADADTFYGYYTLHTFGDGQVDGMLSVNGYTGAVWYHTWHGAFIRMEEFE